MPAEFTSTRTGPMLLAISTALMMSSVLVTSTVQNAPPISSANAVPFSSCGSAMTTLALFAASLRAAAAPMPDAPPVTIALAPVMSMASDVRQAHRRGPNGRRSEQRGGRLRRRRGGHHLQRAGARGDGQPVDEVVHRVTAVALDPLEADLLLARQVQLDERLPQVDVGHRLLLRVAPPVLQPGGVPPVAHAVDDVGGVADDGQL